MTMPRLSRQRLLILAGVMPLLGALATAVQQDPQPPVAAGVDLGGVHLDPAAGLVSFPVVVEVRDDLLEYLVVAPHGAVHESMFVAGVDAEVLNASILALGLEPGKNAKWVARDPAPTREELRAGASAYDVQTPTGDSLFLYLGWREGDEVYWYRVEDMLRDLDRLRTMRRHRWVFLGSRMIKRPSAPDREVFAASVEGNLINMPFFASGTTLLTSAIPEAEKQNIWLPNAWLLPPRGSQLLMVACKDRQATPPTSVLAKLPKVVAGQTVSVEGNARPNAGHVPQKTQASGGEDGR
ncbi:MAG: hypothetical protein ACI9HE_004167 [Planctomycetota bacterium]|jgi:hypothetical protein